MTKTRTIALPFMIAGFIVGMLFGLIWWQALIVAFLSAFSIRFTYTYR